MGAIDVFCFLLKNRDLSKDEEGLTIKMICQGMKANSDKGNTYENVRRSLILLEAKGLVKGHCRGRADNWQRYFKISEGFH